MTLMFGKIFASLLIVISSLQAGEPQLLFNGEDFTGWKFCNYTSFFTFNSGFQYLNFLNCSCYISQIIIL